MKCQSYSTRRIALLLVLFFSLFSGKVTAQDGLNLSFHMGHVLKINEIYPEITQPSLIGEISYQLAGGGVWQRWHPRMRLSFTTHLLRLGNPNVLGNAIGETVDFKFPLFTWGEKAKLSLKVGTGLGWISKPYDRVNNPTNNAIGSHINNLTRLALRIDFQAEQDFQPFFTFSYTHFSNSRFRYPNLGVNIPAIGVGVRWKEDDVPQDASTPRSCNPMRRRNFFTLRLGLGGTAVPAPQGPIYPVYVGALSYQITPAHLKFRWKVGVESFVSLASYSLLRDFDYPFPQTAWNSTGIILFGGAEYLVGKFSLVAHAGPYVKRAFQMDYLLYTKLGAKIHLFNQNLHPNRQPFIGIFMHAHSGESDFLEIALGCNL